jgi:hypothetical protein
MIILYSCIPRPHLGLKFSAIKFRSIPQIDKISRECTIEDGLIVQEVYSVYYSIRSIILVMVLFQSEPQSRQKLWNIGGIIVYPLSLSCIFW